MMLCHTDFPRRRFLSSALALAALPLLPGTALAEHQPYTLLSSAVPKADPGKLEVIEFFSYACSHCYELQPHLKAWASVQKNDVVVRRIAIGVNAAWANMARLYYTLEALGELSRLDDAVFDAIHREGKKTLVSERVMTEWYVEQGGNAEKFTAAFNSFGVMSRMRQGEALANEMKIDSVPTLIVEGRYKVQDNPDEALMTVSMLLAEARKTQVGKGGDAPASGQGAKATVKKSATVQKSATSKP
jgi:thiol:disulfide interchange protein DsbA